MNAILLNTHNHKVSLKLIPDGNFTLQKANESLILWGSKGACELAAYLLIFLLRRGRF